ncbi:ChbG/HpnK family deacetylase [Marivirga harenae]|uniref:ChbG/HpnK family deacetylase n=1 Tax=Marivirga harenae TaxID=2010992 RepID=UPI0026DF7137|nr:ChbG/HpnK family deacetylase [Marivirga harenae]WKV11530.1 ChbG/HpnK family deacetylase [Marivirga harenae]
MYSLLSKLKTNVRVGRPTKSAPLHSTIEKGSTLQVRHAIKGQALEGNDIWYVLDNGNLVWSGGFHASSEIPMIRTKYILATADDYGIYDEIDTGIEYALKNGWINSVAVLVNKHKAGKLDRLFRLQNFLEQHSLKNKVHVGLHFTIASGKPLATNLNSIVNNHGFFKAFWLIHDGYQRNPYLKEVKDEFQMQLEKFQKVFGRPDHISSHFDVLSYNEAFLNLSMQHADILPSAIRSLNYLPYGKRIGMDFITTADIMSARETDKYIKQYEFANQTTINVPDSSIVDHYGPPGFMPVWNYDRQKSKKQHDLSKWIEHFNNDDSRVAEIVFHLIQHEPVSQRAFVRKFRAEQQGYPGLKPNYFDGRVAEMMSLKSKRPWEKSEYNIQFKPKNN